MTKRVLEGIKVLDLSRQFPGPYCTMILADFGADVLRIEDRRFISDMSAQPVMRNKRHITLNLKTDRGKNVFYKLLEKADVVVEGFRPGATERMGIGYNDLARVKPDIICCSLSGYGQTGPYRDMVGHDLNYISTAGVLAICGEPGRRPVIPPVQVADIGGGLNAAIGILLALFHRERTGEGQYVDISLTDAALGFMTLGLMHYGDMGTIPLRGRMPLTGLFPFYQAYECADNKFFTLGAVEPRFWQAFCKAIGHEEFLQDQFAMGERGEIVDRQIRKIFKTKTRDQWFEELKTIDVCIGRVLEIDEVIANPQVQDRRMIVEVEMPTGKKQHIQGIVVKLSKTPGDIRTRPAAFGEHTAEVLKEMGLTDEDIKYCFEKGIC